MDTTQEPILSTPVPAPGIFGTRIPSSVAFVVGVLLFFLPFAEIKCSGTAIANKSGIDIVMAKNWKQTVTKGLSDVNETKQKSMNQDKEDKGNSQIFAIAALGLAVLGLLLSFANAKAGGMGGIVTGLLSAGALVGMMLDIKSSFDKAIANEAMKKAQENTNDFGLNKIGDAFNNAKTTLDFTPWFYIAVIAFLAAAFFSYRRMAATRKN